METRARLRPAPALLAALTALLGAAPAWAAVTAATLAPDKAVFHGDCPAKITFTGKITANGPATVTYRFTRSDGATDTVLKTLHFAGAGSKTVSTTWTLGGPSRPNIEGWQAVKVLSPNALESGHADFKVSCDPPLNSAKAAHGNTDWHIDTANEFLFGRDMAGAATAPNFAPAGWTKTHVHVGLTSAAHFYNDSTRATPGDDNNAANGTDKPMLFFYAGHGAPTVWNTLGDNATQGGLLMGNPKGDGQLRYFWQCTCETFAHGPLVCADGSASCPGGDLDYAAPEDFDGSADSSAMRNAFERWGPALGSGLRMACGVSTLAYCHEGNVNRIWDNFNNKGFSVAESFIDGLGGGNVRPLCITRGGPSIVSTPLYDHTFTNRRNTSGSGFLHMLFAGGSQREPPFIKLDGRDIPRLIVRFRLIPPGDPPPFRQRIVRTPRGEQLRDPQIAGGLARVTRHLQSGAVHLRALDVPAPAAEEAASAAAQDRRPDVARARATALDFARGLGWMDADAGVVTVTPLLTASMPEDKAAGDVRRGVKSVRVTIQRRLGSGPQSLDVEGPGGRVDVLLDADHRVLAASRVWRRAQAAGEVAVKPFDVARDEAARRLQKPEAYRMADWRLVYRERAANVRQPELRAVYEFDFVPQDRERLLDFPPRRVEVSAEKGPAPR